MLGDGRDFFVFRPRALRALSNLIVGKTLIATTNSGVSGREDQVEMGKVSYSKNTIQEYNMYFIPNATVLQDVQHILIKCMSIGSLPVAKQANKVKATLSFIIENDKKVAFKSIYKKKVIKQNK